MLEVCLDSPTEDFIPDCSMSQVWAAGAPTAEAGQFRVTATAKVDKVVWDMGDGITVTCVGAGTPYEDRFDTTESPDCGHRYTKQGEYEVTATSYWTVQWEGMGQSGTIPLDFEASANIVMGEAQVITQ